MAPNIPGDGCVHRQPGDRHLSAKRLLESRTSRPSSICKTADLKSRLQAKSIIDTPADDALVEFDGHVGNYGRSAYIGDNAIFRA